MITLDINGKKFETDAEPDTPLLWAIVLFPGAVIRRLVDLLCMFWQMIADRCRQVIQMCVWHTSFLLCRLRS